MSSGSALAASVASILLAACAAPGDPYGAAPARSQLNADDAQGGCLRRLQAMDARVDSAGVRDAQAQRVDGFPYLRADRYTVLSAPAGSDTRALAQAKIERMAALDSEARRYEAANVRADADEVAAIDRCRDQLLETARPQAESAVARAKAPAAYDNALRVFGLYPLTRIPFSWGVASWQKTTREIYATPFPELPLNGQRVRYVPGAVEAGSGLAGWLPVSPGAAASLRQPALSAERAWQLVRQHAPVVVVETADEDDRIGTLAWRMSGGDLFVAVDAGTPICLCPYGLDRDQRGGGAAAHLYVLVRGSSGQPSVGLGGRSARCDRLARDARQRRPTAAVRLDPRLRLLPHVLPDRKRA